MIAAPFGASSAYLAPTPNIGERLSSAFSKAVAITGPGSN